MTRDSLGTLERRVAHTAEAALAERRFVTPVDLLVGLGWLSQARVDEWRQGRIDCLERATTVAPTKLLTAMRVLGLWAQRHGLVPSEIVYVSRTRDRRSLRFSKSGDPGIERVYRTHWLSPRLSERERGRLLERQSKPPDLVVIAPINDWTCSACGGTGGLLIMDPPGPLCLTCAELDHLVYLPAGDAALTRRARAESGLSAVVVRFSRSRKRYERQGVLVEEEALVAAEQHCLADETARARRRERNAQLRAAEDADLRERFAAEIIRLFPGCPLPRAETIARHAAARGSGRVGRSAAGRAVDPGAVELAVIASVRHEDTQYDELLMTGVGRADAREHVHDDVDLILGQWRLDRSDTAREQEPDLAG